MVVMPELDRKLNDAPDPDGDQADTANAGHNLLKVGNVVGALLHQAHDQ